MSAVHQRAKCESALERVDPRFRVLVGADGWARLPEPVRRRFSKQLAPGQVRIYSGYVALTKLSWPGRVLALFARLIGSPLPASDGAVGPAVVVVSEDAVLGGQTWTRSYARPGRFPQVVHSAKRFSGPTGLEEYVGAGIGMTLCVAAEGGALVFRSQRYFLEALALRLYLPSALSPGVMEIVHRQEDGDCFSFRLTLTHRLFGRLVQQLAYFTEV